MVNEKDAIRKVAGSINARRRKEIFDIYKYKPLFDQINNLRKDEVYKKGSKTMRLLASIPIEVDHFFTKIYGEDYYKDPDFFTRRYTEWNVRDYRSGELEESQQNIKEMFYRGKDDA